MQITQCFVEIHSTRGRKIAREGKWDELEQFVSATTAQRTSEGLQVEVELTERQLQFLEDHFGAGHLAEILEAYTKAGFKLAQEVMRVAS